MKAVQNLDAKKMATDVIRQLEIQNGPGSNSYDEKRLSDRILALQQTLIQEEMVSNQTITEIEVPGVCNANLTSESMMGAVTSELTKQIEDEIKSPVRDAQVRDLSKKPTNSYFFFKVLGVILFGFIFLVCLSFYLRARQKP